jgi:hypothetical protein
LQAERPEANIDKDGFRMTDKGGLPHVSSGGSGRKHLHAIRRFYGDIHGASGRRVSTLGIATASQKFVRSWIYGSSAACIPGCGCKDGKWLVKKARNSHALTS